MQKTGFHSWSLRKPPTSNKFGRRAAGFPFINIDEQKALHYSNGFDVEEDGVIISMSFYDNNESWEHHTAVVKAMTMTFRRRITWLMIQK